MAGKKKLKLRNESLHINWEVVSDVQNNPFEASLPYLCGSLIIQNIETEEETLIAQIQAYTINSYKLNKAGWTVFDALSSIDVEMEEAAKAFYGTEDKLLDDVGEDFLNNNSIYIRTLMVAEGYRGYGLGKILVDDLIETFGGNIGALILIASPLQFVYSEDYLKTLEEDDIAIKANLKNMDQDKELCQSKLESTWIKMGFKKTGKRYFYMNLI